VFFCRSKKSFCHSKKKWRQGLVGAPALFCPKHEKPNLTPPSRRQGHEDSAVALRVSPAAATHCGAGGEAQRAKKILPAGKMRGAPQRHPQHNAGGCPHRGGRSPPLQQGGARTGGGAAPLCRKVAITSAAERIKNSRKTGKT